MNIFIRADNCVTPLALFEKSVLCFFKARLKNKRLAKKLTYLITDSKNYGDFLKKWQPFVKKDIEIEVYTNPISDFSEYMLFYVNSFSRDKRSIDKEAKYYHNLYAGKKIKNMRLLYKKWLKGNSYARQFYSVEDAVNLEPRPIFPG